MKQKAIKVCRFIDRHVYKVLIPLFIANCILSNTPKEACAWLCALACAFEAVRYRNASRVERAIAEKFAIAIHRAAHGVTRFRWDGENAVEELCSEVEHRRRWPEHPQKQEGAEA